MKPEAIGWRNSHHVSSCYKKRLPSPADHQTLKKQFTTSSYSALQKRYSFKMKVVVFSVAVVAMILMATSSQAARVRLMLKLNVTHTRTCTIISCLSKQMDGLIQPSVNVSMSLSSHLHIQQPAAFDY